MSFDEQPDGDPHGECAAEINNLKAEVERLKDLLRTSFDDDHLRIDLHFKDCHIRKLVKYNSYVDFFVILRVIVHDMWEELRYALVRSGRIN